ncbi:alanine--tRNA ligase [Candidatus Saccharibacteria bacterium]|nr:alanine--tRNA ligase [Candidatus Saccharibacteria bacterium]
MKTHEVREKYLNYFKNQGHAIVPSASIVPQEDPTTLFTGSGMQPMLQFLLGETHPEGVRIVDSQTCFRAEDIDDVGDNRHTTFFEMLGNWSLGDYFKSDQLNWFFEFLTSEVGLDPKKLFVTAFIGDKDAAIDKDEEAAEIWKRLFKAKGIDAKVVDIGSEEDGYQKGMQGGRIFYYDSKKNWWSRAGVPSNMPAGEPGGPDSEVFYEVDYIEHDPSFGPHCHPNCDCGRYMEIGNSVFMQYQKQPDGSFKELDQKNIDFGGGLERIAAASIDSGDMFKIDVLWNIIQKLQDLTGKKYEDHVVAKRVIADHLRSAVFMAVNGVVPSNTAQGYVMRRLLRRAIRRGHELGIESNLTTEVAQVVIDEYQQTYPELQTNNQLMIEVLRTEENLFRKTLERGIHEFTKRTSELDFSKHPPTPTGQRTELTGKLVFTLFDTYGFPAELSIEEAEKEGVKIQTSWKKDFDKLMLQQKDRSRTATAGQFKGGLAEHSETTTKYHTATHLMYKALRNVLGDHVVQRGSNITNERLRFDFSHGDKMTPEQIKAVEDMVNSVINKDMPVTFVEMGKDDAFGIGALGAFGEKYPDTVKVYTVGDPGGDYYSKEICGGPHVEHTGLIGKFKIIKEESSSAGVRRIKAVVE